MSGASLRLPWLIWLAAALLLALTRRPALAEQAPAVASLPAQIRFDQRLGERLPLELEFADESGQPLRLARLFDGKPVVLVLGYFHCQALCSTVLDSVMQSLIASGLPAARYRLVAVSIDPQETPAIARRKKAGYAALLGREGIELHVLTGSQPAIDALARSAGFGYAYDRGSGQYLHPAGFLLATPQGRIARYFPGAGFEPGEVRRAVEAAGQGGIGALAQQVLLACAHYDPQTGRYSIAAMTAMRVFMLAVLLALLGGWWRLRRREAARGR